MPSLKVARFVAPPRFASDCKGFQVQKLPPLPSVAEKVGESNSWSCVAILSTAQSLLFPDTSLPNAEESAKSK